MARVLQKFGREVGERREAAIQQLGHLSSIDELNANLSRSARKGRNKRRRVLGEMGNVATCVDWGGSEAYRIAVARALEMKRDWLLERGRRTSVVDDAETLAFLKTLPGGDAMQMDEKGRPQGAFTYSLKVNGEPIAIEISFIKNGHIYSFLGAFDWKHKDLSPGKIQMEMGTAWAIESGFDAYDYLGEPAEYKQHWSDSAEALCSRGVALTFKGFVYQTLWMALLRPRAAALLEAMSPQMRKRIIGLLERSKSNDEAEGQSIKNQKPALAGASK